MPVSLKQQTGRPRPLLDRKVEVAAYLDVDLLCLEGVHGCKVPKAPSVPD